MITICYDIVLNRHLSISQHNVKYYSNWHKLTNNTTEQTNKDKHMHDIVCTLLYRRRAPNKNNETKDWPIQKQSINEY